MRRWWMVLGLCWLLLSGCSLKKMAASMTASVVKDASRALEEEGDYELAAAAIPGNLKLVEGLLQVIPDNAELLELLARSFASYAMAFAEEAANEARAAGDEDRYEKLVNRAIALYERGGRYGLRLLGLKRGFDDAWKKGGDALEQKLAEFGPGEEGQLFWTGYAWAGAINLGQDRVENLALLPKVLALMKRVLAINEAYYFGGAHLFMGGYLMSLPRALGGKPEKAKEHFERAVALTGGKSLLVKMLYAELYARKAEPALFERLLEEVRDASLDALPEMRLGNALAKRKARRLAKKEE
jgi:tetratricopeptide (TPR) repeat protein